MVTILIIMLSLAALAVIRSERRGRNRAQIEHHYLQMLLLGDSQSERYIEELTLLSGRVARQSVADVIADLSPIIYRMDPQWLESVTRSLHLGDYLLDKTARRRGAARAIALSTFAKIPYLSVDIDRLVPYINSEDRMVRLFALLALINADRANAMRYIASYPSPLTPFELSQLIFYLRQGSMAVAYQPMLRCSNLNLNMLGVAVVCNFGIESAEEELREIIDKGDDFALRREALYTLGSMQLTLCTPSILLFVGKMPNIERRRFLRYIASEGYSHRVLRFFVTERESLPLMSFINSYKI